MQKEIQLTDPKYRETFCGKVMGLSAYGNIKEFKKDKHSSVGLLKAVNKRKKLLDYLKRNKLDSYKNVISKLNIRK